MTAYMLPERARRVVSELQLHTDDVTWPQSGKVFMTGLLVGQASADSMPEKHEIHSPCIYLSIPHET